MSFGNQVSLELIRNMIASSFAFHFTSLDLSNNHLGIQECELLANGSSLVNLKILNVEGNGKLGDEGVQVLMSSRFLSNITQLVLRDVGIGDKGVEYIATCQNMSNLRVLYLGYNRIQGKEGCHLSNSPILSNLTDLELERNILDSSSFESIANCTHWTLSILNVNFNHIQQITRLDKASVKTKLMLRGNEIGPESAQVIAQCCHFSNLKYLDLSYNPIGPTGMKYIVNGPYLSNLEKLKVYRSCIEEEGGLSIAHHGMNLPKLRSLDVDGNGIGFHTLEMIKNNLKCLEKMYPKQCNFTGR